MEFTVTRHAQSRFKERGIEPPNSSMSLKPAGRKTRRAIRERCARIGVKADKVYWVLDKRTVYVCHQEDVGRYVVLTAFVLE